MTDFPSARSRATQPRTLATSAWLALAGVVLASVLSVVRIRVVDSESVAPLGPSTVARVSAKDVFGRPVSLREFDGRVLLVNFWATWCGPCRSEIPVLIELQKRYGGQLQIVGISDEGGAVGVLQRFVAERGISYPVILANPVIHDAFPHVRALPTSFLYDHSRRLVHTYTGAVDASTVNSDVLALLGDHAR